MNRLDDEILEERLRTTLHRVADSPTPVRQRRLRPLLAIGLVVVVATGFVAWNALGPGEIDRIPTERAVSSGIADDGTQWWLIPTSAVMDQCGGQMPGVVFVSAELNRPGQEWNMGGVAYGEPSTSNFACAPPDQANWLNDPTRSSFGHQRLGPNNDPGSDIGVYGTVHPSIHTIKVTSDVSPPLDVQTVTLPDDPDGPRYAAFTLPHDASRFTLAPVAADGSTITTETVTVGV